MFFFCTNTSFHDALICTITHYGSRQVEDFDKYEALRQTEDLVPVAKTSNNPNATSYEIIPSTLRGNIYVPREQFKAYLLAFSAQK